MPSFVTVILIETDGLPEDTEVFTSEESGKKRFIELVNDQFDRNFNNFDDAKDFMNRNWDEWGVRLFITELKE